MDNFRVHTGQGKSGNVREFFHESGKKFHFKRSGKSQGISIQGVKRRKNLASGNFSEDLRTLKILIKCNIKLDLNTIYCKLFNKGY